MTYNQTQASRKYNEKAYDRIYLTVKKGEKAKIKLIAKQQRMSLNRYINKIISEKILQKYENL